jgi:hypothetical protein
MTTKAAAQPSTTKSPHELTPAEKLLGLSGDSGPAERLYFLTLADIRAQRPDLSYGDAAKLLDEVSPWMKKDMAAERAGGPVG